MTSSQLAFWARVDEVLAENERRMERIRKTVNRKEQEGSR